MNRKDWWKKTIMTVVICVVWVFLFTLVSMFGQGKESSEFSRSIANTGAGLLVNFIIGVFAGGGIVAVWLGYLGNKMNL